MKDWNMMPLCKAFALLNEPEPDVGPFPRVKPGIDVKAVNMMSLIVKYIEVKWVELVCEQTSWSHLNSLCFQSTIT